MRKILTAIGLFLLLAVSSVSFAEERNEIIRTFAEIDPSVGALYAQEEDGDMSFLCSATAIDRHEKQTVILTANHCLKKGVSYLIDFGDRQMRPLKVWKIPHYEVDSIKFPRRYGQPETDMALFLMDGVDTPVLSVGDNNDFEPGTKVAMVGYPLGVAKISYEGIVAGRYDRPGSDQDGYILLQIFGAPGSSGSSVIDVETGKIVGVLVSARQSVAGLPVIFATPIGHMKYLKTIHPQKE